MLNNLLEFLYLKVLINIVVKRESTVVHIEVCSRKAVVDEISREFQTTVLNDKMYDFISQYIKESPYFYIAILDTSIVQGAIPTCEKSRLGDYYDLSLSEYKCFDEKWTFYTAKNDIYEIERKYEDIGVDMIFSPFVLLANFFKDKIDASLAMYVLIQDDFVSVAVFEHSRLLYAQHLDILITEDKAEEIIFNDDIEFDLDEDIDLEDIDEDGIDSLEEFGDIEDLDALEDIDEFSENKDVGEELFESDTHLPENDENESFNEDYQRFSLIQNAVANFYKDDKYESRFIENIYIADGAGVTNDLKTYLEEEMFFNVYVRKMDLALELAELTKMELGL